MQLSRIAVKRCFAALQALVESTPRPRREHSGLNPRREHSEARGDHSEWAHRAIFILTIIWPTCHCLPVLIERTPRPLGGASLKGVRLFDSWESILGGDINLRDLSPLSQFTALKLGTNLQNLQSTFFTYRRKGYLVFEGMYSLLPALLTEHILYKSQQDWRLQGMHGVAVAMDPWSLGKPEVLGLNPSQAAGGLVGIT
ncbi:hypothetical protein GGX14DRAFT_648042 [Mycena pura]|uniref:Uncharacterized protein n=1 Tax=Mycena pura TaxID=153505 RepID=A0AAD6V6L4_9AGAR|nr:hypothetical protein GGX14DRAFT_648042 [Mycena pura]